MSAIAEKEFTTIKIRLDSTTEKYDITEENVITAVRKAADHSLVFKMANEAFAKVGRDHREILVYGLPEEGKFLNGDIPNDLPFDLQLGVSETPGTWISYTIEDVSITAYYDMRIVDIRMTLRKRHDSHSRWHEQLYRAKTRVDLRVSA